MKLRRLIFALCLAFLSATACNTLYDDTGSTYPGQWWPWVCADGSPAPDSGCPLPTACPDGGTPDGDGGC